MLIYVSGAYSSDTEEGVARNIEHACQVASKLWEMGHAVITPHANTAWFDKRCNATYEQYIAGDLVMLARCDAILMLDGWETSKGANIERDYSIGLDVPVYYEKDGLPGLHVTEIRCPFQSRAFVETVSAMYRTHLRKNADYSPMNVLGTGGIGVVVRLWDKMARILSLSGFVMRAEFVEFKGEKSASNESLEDSYMDMAVYAVIALLLRRNVWGR